jgi:hypothetical protein
MFGIHFWTAFVFAFVLPSTLFLQVFLPVLPSLGEVSSNTNCSLTKPCWKLFSKEFAQPSKSVAQGNKLVMSQDITFPVIPQSPAEAKAGPNPALCPA